MTAQVCICFNQSYVTEFSEKAPKSLPRCCQNSKLTEVKGEMETVLTCPATRGEDFFEARTCERCTVKLFTNLPINKAVFAGNFRCSLTSMCRKTKASSRPGSIPTTRTLWFWTSKLKTIASDRLLTTWLSRWKTRFSSVLNHHAKTEPPALGNYLCYVYSYLGLLMSYIRTCCRPNQMYDGKGDCLDRDKFSIDEQFNLNKSQLASIPFFTSGNLDKAGVGERMCKESG